MRKIRRDIWNSSVVWPLTHSCDLHHVWSPVFALHVQQNWATYISTQQQCKYGQLYLFPSGLLSTHIKTLKQKDNHRHKHTPAHAHAQSQSEWLFVNKAMLLWCYMKKKNIWTMGLRCGGISVMLTAVVCRVHVSVLTYLLGGQVLKWNKRHWVYRNSSGGWGLYYCKWDHLVFY